MQGPDSSARWRTLLPYLVLLIIFSQAGLYAARTSRADNFPADVLPASSAAHPRVLGTLPEHPITLLMDDAESQFRAKLSKQSKSLRVAVQEYRKRYGRAPPKGFDKWWEFAQKHGVKMVDEFDALVGDLAPFWTMSGAEFRRMAGQAARELPSVDVVRIRGGIADTVKLTEGAQSDDVGMRARGFLRMLAKFKDTLPDMDFVINARSEGRVLVPWENRMYPNLSSIDVEKTREIQDSLRIPDWRGSGSVWDAYRRICAPGTPARRAFGAVRASDSLSPSPYLSLTPSPYDTDTYFARALENSPASGLDLCANPAQRVRHGHLFSDWRTAALPFPVLSPARAPGFLDIRVPSHYYHGTTRRYTYAWDEVNLEPKKLDPLEIPWERKEEKVFWRGATTGGGSSPPGFAPEFQRHRLVRMATTEDTSDRTLIFADPPSSSHYIYTRLPGASLTPYQLDAAFVSSVDAASYPGGLEAEMESHRFADAVNLRALWAHKYVLDLDGAGYSGKFFALLASDSAVIKASVHEEFWADWIQPWLHFIPLSSSYRELHNIHAFFSGAPATALEAVNSSALAAPEEERRSLDGDRRLRRIARAGKQWRATIGRQIDMEAYVYRLCLEYARLWADDRDAMSYR